MQSEQFDKLTRLAASGVSRRGVLKMLAAAVISSLWPFPSRKGLAAVQVSGLRIVPHPVIGTCQQYQQAAHANDACGRDAFGCTLPNYEAEQLVYHINEPTKSGKAKNKEYCATGTATVVFTAHPVLHYLEWQNDTPNACCKPECQAYTELWNSRLLQHEQIHVQDFNVVLGKYISEWASKSFEACTEKKKDAKAAVLKAMNDARLDTLNSIDTELANLAAAWDATDTDQPDCSLCGEITDACGACVNGRCGLKPDCCQTNSDCRNPCEECVPESDPVAGVLLKCKPIDCGDSCLECQNGTCVAKPGCCHTNSDCNACETCINGTCSTGTNLRNAALTACGSQCCDSCQECINDNCQPKQCGPCQECQNGTCVAKPGCCRTNSDCNFNNCEICDQNGVCVSKCTGGNTCNGAGVCGCPQGTSLCTCNHGAYVCICPDGTPDGTGNCNISTCIPNNLTCCFNQTSLQLYTCPVGCNCSNNFTAENPTPGCACPH